jgi:SAM-dependent methyltransferase
LADLSWEWDETLYAGSAPYYARGRLPYPPALADAFRDALGLDGSGRLLDGGCGPGSLTHLLAPLFAEAVGVDADPAMVAEAEKGAGANERFVVLRAEDLPAGLGSFRVVTFAQSFHWLDQRRVAAAVHGLLDAGGAVVLVGATTHEGEETDVPRDEIGELVRRYLGPVRRAGRGTLPSGTATWDTDAFAAAGFAAPREVEVPAGRVHERSEDDVVASVYSTSSAAPHLFGDRLGAFEAELRALLRRASPEGRFHEKARDIGLRIWTKSGA